ncbi:MAG: ABC transporter substrate-binding protein [Desulfobacterota bacterium]|jgi:ABC-type branched-subunit amino acid transport system substrate-binding protein|nr:ABC transporter substrate-binding protein [Thermodesulfobacteriota bacterium]
MKMKAGLIGMVSLVLILGLVFSTQAAPTPGVTDTEVVIGMSTPLSGPAALWGTTALGAKAWADYVNDKGGVHGRKIKVILKDDGYNPARAMANLTEMKGQIFAFCALLGTAVANATKDFFAENKIPLITAYANVRIWAKYPKDKLKYVFVSYPDYENEGEYLTNYAFKNLGAKKLAVFYQNDDYGKEALDGVRLAVSKLPGKPEIAGAVPFEVTERALATHAQKLKETGADTLVIYPTMNHGALILKEMAKIGFKPKVVACFTLGDPIMFNLAGPEVWEGVYPAAPAHSGIPGEPASDKAIEILKKYDPKLAGKEYLALFGAMSMMHLVKGLENAGKNLTVDGLIKGMEMIKNWQPEGIGAPVTYGPDRRHGVNGSRILKAEKGRHVPVTDYNIYKPLF